MTSIDEDDPATSGLGGGGSSTDEPLDRIETGLNALFAAEVVEEIYEAVDFEALRAGEAAGEAIDHEHLARAIGDPIGRIFARRVASKVTSGGVTGVVGRELAGRIGTAVVHTILEHSEPEAALERLVNLVESSGWEETSPDFESGEGTKVPFEDETDGERR